MVALRRFPFNKNYSLTFRKFHMPQWNGTFRLPRPNPSHRAFAYCSCKQDIKEWYWGQQFGEMERDISVRPTKITGPVKVDHLQSWSCIFWSDQTEMVHSIWCTNQIFRNFQLNGKRPWSVPTIQCIITKECGLHWYNVTMLTITCEGLWCVTVKIFYIRVWKGRDENYCDGGKLYQQGLEGYFWDPGFAQNTKRDSQKHKIL